MVTDPETRPVLDKLREHLAHADRLLPLAMVGLVTGGVIIAFRWLTENSRTMLTPLDDPDAFEWLPWEYRLGLPVASGLFIDLIFQRAAVGSRQVGVVHVMECLAYHSARLPWRNAVLQFFGGALSILSRHSVGREGPVIHVGAASSSLLGQWLGLPNNSLRVLVACGAAASIAGVIFAMEVILMEYTLVGFTPVILASVAATACVSLGLPGGLIGPTLVMGAASGGALGVVGHAILPDLSASAGFYAMLGMGAMMGATLQAPLAALMAILELTANSNSILPGMFAIVTATLTTRVVFKKDSIFISMLEARGLEYRHDPVAISLSRTGVGAVMGRRLQPIPCRGKTKALPDVKARTPDWVLATDDCQVVSVLPGDALIKYMNSLATKSDSVEDYDLLEIDGARSKFSMVSLQTTPRDALERMDRASTDVVLVTRAGTSAPVNVRGVLTRDQIEAGVRYRV